MKTKILFIGGILITVAVLILLFYLRFTQSPGKSKEFTSFVPSPQVSHLVISGISVKDFSRTATKIDPQDDRSLIKNESYQIVYLKQFNEFIITILTPDFDSGRAQAEKEFLKQLGIGREGACKLQVTISTPFSVNPQYAGLKYPLSFCRNL